MNIKTITRICLPILFAAAGLEGCNMKENTDNCPRASIYLTVTAYDESRAELDESQVDRVTLYLFDGALGYLYNVSARLGDTVEIESLEEGDIHIVAWGNLSGDNIVNTGDNFGGFSIEVGGNTREAGYIPEADDIFLGSVTLGYDDQQGEKELPIYRQMGSMSITVRGVDKLTRAGEEYWFVVRDTWSRIGFDGSLSGERVSYRPGYRLNFDEYLIGPFSIVPEEEGVEIEVYRDEELLTTVTSDSDGAPITVYRGQLTNVLIEFGGGTELSVVVSVTPWGEDQIWKEF